MRGGSVFGCSERAAARKDFGMVDQIPRLNADCHSFDFAKGELQAPRDDKPYPS